VNDKPLLAILLLALVIRLAAIPLVHQMSYTSDEKEYLAMGKTLLERGLFVDTNGDRAVRAPLYPFFTAGLLAVTGGARLPLHVVGALLGVLNVVLVFLLTQTFWVNRRAALLAAGGMALYPGLVIYSTLLQSETLYITFVLAAFLSFMRLADHPTVGRAVILGLFCGLAALTRVVFLGFIPIVAILVAVRHGAVLRKGIGLAGTVAVVAALTIAPWTVRNALTLGRWVTICSGGGSSLLTGNNPYATGTYRTNVGFDEWFEGESTARGGAAAHLMPETDRSAMSSRIALDYMLSHPGDMLAGWAHKAYIFWIYPITHTDSDSRIQMVAVGADLAVLVFAWAGVLAMWFLRKRLLPVFAALLFFSMAQVVLHAEARFRLPLSPFLIMFAAWGWNPEGTERGLRGLIARVRERKALLAGWIVIAGLYAFTAYLHVRGEL
jgi:4-amino-4-deoxy-L-arabinose transferase-like glycosyltransferase